MMRLDNRTLASADRSAIDAVGVAAAAFSTDLVRRHLKRIDFELSQAVEKHSSYTEWLVGVLEQNVESFLAYDQAMADELARLGADSNLTSRYP